MHTIRLNGRRRELASIGLIFSITIYSAHGAPVQGVVPATNLQSDASSQPGAVNPDVPTGEVGVTMDNWRDVILRLDNVYQVPSVLHLRGPALAHFVSRMRESDQKRSWIAREGIRKAAIKELDTCRGGMRDIASVGPPQARYEAALSLVEIDWMMGKFSNATDAAIPLIRSLPAGRLRDQAYFYLIQSYQRLADGTNSTKYLNELTKINTKAVLEFYTTVSATGRERRLAFIFADAQDEDDVSLLLAGTDLGIAAAAKRDRAIERAAHLRRESSGLQPNAA